MERNKNEKKINENKKCKNEITPLIIETNENKNKYQNNLAQNNNLLNYISLIKIISATFVVMMHTNQNYYIFNIYWISTNIMTSFAYCAVPLFSLCIGATLLNFNEKYGLKEYFKRRFKKIIIPIIGWNIIYYFYRIYIIKNFKLEDFNFIILYNIYFFSKLYPIVNSLRIFIIGYMIIPLIAYVEKKNKIKIYSYCFIALFINQSLIPYLITMIKPDLNYWPYNYDFGYVIYLFSGYIIQNYKFNYKYKYLIYISGIISVLLRLTISHYITLKNKKVDKSQLGYVNLPCVIYSCSVFLFIKEYSIYLFKIIDVKYINKIGSLSMGPFFLHYMIIWILPYILNYNEYSFNYRFFGSFIISFFCFIITAIIKKIPIIKYLTP